METTAIIIITGITSLVAGYMIGNSIGYGKGLDYAYKLWQKDYENVFNRLSEALQENLKLRREVKKYSSEAVDEQLQGFIN